MTADNYNPNAPLAVSLGANCRVYLTAAGLSIHGIEPDAFDQIPGQTKTASPTARFKCGGGDVLYFTDTDAVA